MVPRRLVNFLKQPFLAAVSITGADFLTFFLLLGREWKPAMTLVLLLEGGLGLLAGTGIALSSTPSISKVGETMLGTASWSKDAEKHGEKVGLKWMLGSCLLIAIGFGLSLI